MGGATLVTPPLGTRCPRLEGCPISDAMEPAADRCQLADRHGLPSEDEERSLKSVFHIVFLAQNVATDVEHHRSVTAQQAIKRRFVLAAAKAAQQLGIGQVADTRVFEGTTNKMQQRVDGFLGHRAASRKAKGLLLIVVPRVASSGYFFLGIPAKERSSRRAYVSHPFVDHSMIASRTRWESTASSCRIAISTGQCLPHRQERSASWAVSKVPSWAAANHWIWLRSCRASWRGRSESATIFMDFMK